ncbi:alanine racemase [Microbacterium sp. NPDC055357]
MTSLTAHISRSALAGNAASALADGDGVADLRRDAWGHGLPLVAEVLAAAGVRAAVVDEADRAALTAAGLTAVAEPTIDGALLFGLPGSGGMPVLRLSARVLSIKSLRRGEGVSYGYTHRAASDTRVALVDGGYGQGLPRAIGNAVSVEIGGRLHPLVGRIAMDVCVVDIGDSAVGVGDEVVYFGGSPSPRDCNGAPRQRADPAVSASPCSLAVNGGVAGWAAASGLSAAEIVCGIGLHTTRVDAA